MHHIVNQTEITYNLEFLQRINFNIYVTMLVSLIIIEPTRPKKLRQLVHVYDYVLFMPCLQKKVDTKESLLLF